MLDVINITEFLEGYFITYGLDNPGVYIELDCDDRKSSTLFPDGIYRREKLEELTELTGLSVEEMEEGSEDTMERYKRQYPYFDLEEKFSHKYMWRSRHDVEDEEQEAIRFLKILFGDKEAARADLYDIGSIRKRLNDKLKQADEFFPGTVHAGAEIESLWYSTERIVSFPEYPKMMQSLFNMVLRLKMLFFKAVKEGLPDEEQRELTFLANALKADDMLLENVRLTYKNVVWLGEVYRKENLKDFFSYVKLHRLDDTYFWRCQEFYQDIDMVKKFLSIYPEGRSRLREFGMSLSHFDCWYYWTDEDIEWESLIDDYDLDEEDIDEFVDEVMDDRFLDPEDLTGYYEKMLSFRHRVYVEKTESEYLGFKVYIDRIRALTAPPKKGGLPLRKWECKEEKLTLPSGEVFDRVAARKAALEGRQ